MDNIPTWMALTISAGVGLLIAVLVQVVLVPLHRRQILNRPVEFTFGDSDGKFTLQNRSFLSISIFFHKSSIIQLIHVIILWMWDIL